MQSETKSGLMSLLPLLIGTIAMLANILFQWMSNEHFQKFVAIIPYTQLLTICLLLLCSILSLIIFYSHKVRHLSEKIKLLSIDTNKPQLSEEELNTKSKFDPTNHKSQKILEKELKESRIKLLKNLSGEEKRVLRSYFEKDTKSRLFHVADGVPAGLASKGILFNPSAYIFGVEIAYNITEWAWEMLKDNPKLLEPN